MKIRSLLFGIALLLFLSFRAHSQDNWGIGIRLGDPSGLTIKRYLGGHALEVNVGRTHLWYGPYWYDKHFHHWYDHQHFDYDDYEYFGYDRSIPIAVQLHYLFQKPIGDASGEGGGGLEWYMASAVKCVFRLSCMITGINPTEIPIGFM